MSNVTFVGLYMEKLLLTVMAAMLCAGASAEDVYEADRARWLRIADEAKPALHYQVVEPVAVVRSQDDGEAFQGWRYEATGETVASVLSRNFKEVKEVTLDFGKHLVGYFRFHTKTLNRCQDAPVRLKFFFGELPAELNTPLDPWTGGLSRAWMQESSPTGRRVCESTRRGTTAGHTIAQRSLAAITLPRRGTPGLWSRPAGQWAKR